MSPYLKAGRVKALAVPGKARSPLLPDVPTLGELGVPGFEAVGWFGVLAPAGTPRAIVDRLNTVARDMLADAQNVRRLAELGLTPIGGSPTNRSRSSPDPIRRIREWPGRRT